jgi:excisionase family DNA binding protein
VKQLYDVRDAAEILRVSPWTVRAYIRKGRLRPIRLGRLVRLEESQLQQLVVESTEGDQSKEEKSDDGPSTAL